MDPVHAARAAQHQIGQEAQLFENIGAQGGRVLLQLRQRCAGLAAEDTGRDGGILEVGAHGEPVAQAEERLGETEAARRATVHEVLRDPHADLLRRPQATRDVVAGQLERTVCEDLPLVDDPEAQLFGDCADPAGEKGRIRLPRVLVEPGLGQGPRRRSSFLSKRSPPACASPPPDEGTVVKVVRSSTVKRNVLLKLVLLKPEFCR